MSLPRKILSFTTLLLAVAVVVAAGIAALKAIGDDRHRCFRPKEAPVFFTALSAAVLSIILLVNSWCYRPAVYRVSVHLTAVAAVILITFLVIRAQSLLSPKVDWKDTAACLTGGHYCGGGGWLEGCCKEPKGCRIGEPGTTDCALWRADGEPPVMCYYCAACKRAVIAQMTASAHSLFTVVADLSGLGLTVVALAHALIDLLGKWPYQTAAAAVMAAAATGAAAGAAAGIAAAAEA